MKIKKKHVYGAVFIAVLLAALAGAHYSSKNRNMKNPAKADSSPDKPDTALWLVDKDGYLVYPLSREDVKFRRENYSQTENLTVSRIIYQSRNGNIYGLLILPKYARELMPGVVLLPGAGVSKESELNIAEKIAGLGAAVITIDQRGVGETGGYFPDLDEDYTGFLDAKEPYQHLMVYDALRAYDLLYSAPFVDPERIIIAGESLGGRIAIIAASIDKNIKGVLVISSAGFDFKGGPDPKKNAFLKSIDSDHYIALIAPRKMVMMHNSHDKNIPLNSAINSFSKAQEPKHFVLVNDTSCNHGYCESMYNGMADALDYLVDIKSRTLISVPDSSK